MSELKQQIKEFAKTSGIDLVGFASKDRFDSLAPELNPFTIFPEGNTVILVGRRITRGTLRGIEEGSNFYDYHLFGYQWLDDEFVAQACYDMVLMIENQGWEAVPIYPNPPESTGMGIPVSEGKVAPNVTPDFDYAAVACGLGEIGLNGTVLTKKLGHRQRFQMIITDAVIEPDEIMKESICDSCGKCVAVCPLKALDDENAKEVEICGKTMKVAKVNYDLCKKCRNGALQNRQYPTAKPDRLAALCNRSCMCHLEEKNRIESSFENQFRKRDIWGFDIYDKKIKVNP